MPDRSSAARCVGCGEAKRWPEEFVPGPVFRCIPCETKRALVEGDELTSVYRFFDGDGVLLYVGVTAHGVDRLHSHARTKAWWHEVVTATFQHFPSRALALLAESVAIRLEHPRHNVAGVARQAEVDEGPAELPDWALPVVARLRASS